MINIEGIIKEWDYLWNENELNIELNLNRFLPVW